MAGVAQREEGRIESVSMVWIFGEVQAHVALCLAFEQLQTPAARHRLRHHPCR